MADPVTWAAIASVAVGTIVSAGAAYQQGEQADAAAKYQARIQQRQAEIQRQQTEYAATQERASAQREAIQERQKQEFVTGRARAIAAASGDASDPGVVDILTGISTEGGLRQAAVLFEGEERARGYEFGGQIAGWEAGASSGLRLYEGSAAKSAGRVKAGATLVSGGAGLYGKYG
jgi:hypothetical protein